MCVCPRTCVCGCGWYALAQPCIVLIYEDNFLYSYLITIPVLDVTGAGPCCPLTAGACWVYYFNTNYRQSGFIAAHLRFGIRPYIDLPHSYKHIYAHAIVYTEHYVCVCLQPLGPSGAAHLRFGIRPYINLLHSYKHIYAHAIVYNEHCVCVSAAAGDFRCRPAAGH